MAACVAVEKVRAALLGRVNALKREGNDCFCTGTKNVGDEVGNESLRNACVLYGQAIETIMELESASMEEDINGGGKHDKEPEAAVGDADESTPSRAQFEHDDQLSSLKVSLFLNLAQSNIYLGSYDGAARCCNAALQLCNDPFLLLSDLAPTDDDAELIEPVPPAVVLLATKALFRRGKCYSELGDPSRALDDFRAADRLSPHSKPILDSMADAEAQLRLSDNSVSVAASVSALDVGEGAARVAAATATTVGCSTERAESESGASVASSSRTNATTAATATTTATTTAGSAGKRGPIPYDQIGNRNKINIDKGGGTSGSRAATLFPPELSTNGGQCWLRKGYWSQTTTDATVYLPVTLFNGSRGSGDVTVSDSIRQQWDVSFKRMAVHIAFNKSSSSVDQSSHSSPAAAKSLELRLEHIIMSSECTWTMERIDGNVSVSDIASDHSGSGLTTDSRSRQYVVLHLIKAPSVEWFPGCEWWDRVFAGDEAIDTMTCTVGADVRQLPPEALEKAEKEHRRFTDMSAEQRALELDTLTQTKKDFFDAEQRTRDAAEAEDLSLEEVPERAEMLEALRSQFPQIDFKSK